MSGWDLYIYGQLVHSQQKNGEWLKDVTTEAAIIGKEDGKIQACTPGFKLGEYPYEVLAEDGINKKPVQVNEVNMLKAAVLDGKTTISEAGLRINNTKYMMANYDPARKLAYLSKSGGGACAMATKNLIIFATYENKKKMSNGIEQNAGECNEVVEKVADSLIKVGS